MINEIYFGNLILLQLELYHITLSNKPLQNVLEVLKKQQEHIKSQYGPNHRLYLEIMILLNVLKFVGNHPGVNLSCIDKI